MKFYSSFILFIGLYITTLSQNSISINTIRTCLAEEAMVDYVPLELSAPEDFLQLQPSGEKLALFNYKKGNLPSNLEGFFVKTTTLLRIKNIDLFKSRVGNLLKSIPGNWKEYNSGNVIFLLTIHNMVDKEEIFSVMVLHEHKFFSIILQPDIDMCNHDYFKALFKSIHDSKMPVIWQGDNLTKYNLYEYAIENDVEIYRRSNLINKYLPPISDLKQFSLNSFDSDKSFLINGIPASENELELTGFSRAGIESWKSFRTEVENISRKKFKKLKSENFKNTLINGESDIVMIVAHSDEYKLYVNGEAFSIKEIRNWENSRDRYRNRICVLISCNTGQIQKPSSGFWSWLAPKESFTELLLDKGYFDLIYSPDHEVDDKECLDVLQMLINKKSYFDICVKYKGWNYFVKSNPNFTKNAY